MPIAELIGKTLDPLTAKRGFALRQVAEAWPDIVGPRYADCSLPEKIVWPRTAAPANAAGMLAVRIEGPRALLFQHEVGQVIERINATLGPGTIDRIRIVQGNVRRDGARTENAPPRALDSGDERRLAGMIEPVAGEALRSALDRLGRAVLSGGDNKS